MGVNGFHKSMAGIATAVAMLQPRSVISLEMGRGDMHIARA